MKATLNALAAVSLLVSLLVSLFLGATPASARDTSWRDYDCRRYNRLTAGVGTHYIGRLYPGDVIKSYARQGWRRPPFI